MRDQFNLSGDFRGASININSSLNRARQSVDNGSFASGDVTETLRKLLDQLSAELQTVEPTHQAAAQALATSTAVVVEAASSKQTDATLIRVGARKVRECGKTLLKSSPVIASTVETILDIVEKVATLAGK